MEIFDIYERYPALASVKNEIEQAVQMIVDCYKSGGKVLICGNGGSAADAEHISGELIKGFLSRRELTQSEKSALERIDGGTELASVLQRGIPAIPLVSLSAANTAYANDCVPDFIFAQDVFALGKAGDVFIGISTSGNSKNVVSALKVAAAFGIKSIALTGAKPSESEKYATVTIKAPETETFKIQEYHLPIYHYICAKVEKIIFG